MITTVTLNPAIDRSILIGGLEYGRVNRTNRGREEIGGKGINISKVLSQFYQKNMAIGFLGKENTEDTYKLLEKDNIKHDFVLVDDVTRTNTIIVEVDQNRTTSINEKGFTINEHEYADFVKKMKQYADQSEFMIFSGSLPGGLTEDAYKNLILQIKDDVKTVLDADNELLIEGLKASPYLVKPNIRALETAFDCKIESDLELVQRARDIIATYEVTMVLVSLGKEGALLVTSDEAYKAEPLDVEVKNTVGAGDSMVGGFLNGLSAGYTLKECLAYASACGTLTVMTEANESPNHTLLNGMLKQLNIVDISH